MRPLSTTAADWSTESLPDAGRTATHLPRRCRHHRRAAFGGRTRRSAVLGRELSQVRRGRGGLEATTGEVCRCRRPRPRVTARERARHPERNLSISHGYSRRPQCPRQAGANVPPTSSRVRQTDESIPSGIDRLILLCQSHMVPLAIGCFAVSHARSGAVPHRAGDFTQ